MLHHDTCCINTYIVLSRNCVLKASVDDSRMYTHIDITNVVSHSIEICVVSIYLAPKFFRDISQKYFK